MNSTTGLPAGNFTFGPLEPLPLFDTGAQVATALVVLPVLFTWWLVWRCAPRKGFRTENPYVTNQYLYSVMSGTMVGFMAGHIMPNALIGDSETLKFGGFFLGVAITAAFFKFMRCCGGVDSQVMSTVWREPHLVFDEETGDETDYVSTSIGTTPAAVVNVRRPSSYSYSESGGIDSSADAGMLGLSGSSRDVSPRRQALIGQAAGDDLAEDSTAVADHSDIVWFRRWMAVTVYIIYILYSMTDGVFLVFNYHDQPAPVLLVCFYLAKLSETVTLSGFFIFGYIHVKTPGRRCCCLCRRWMYPVAGLVFATVTLLGCLPVYMSVPTEEVAAWLVPNVAFGVFSALFGGVLMALAMLFVFYEVPEASSRSEFCWWIVFLSTGMVTFLTGCFL